MWAEISEFIQQGPIRSEIIQSVLLIIGVLLVRSQEPSLKHSFSYTNPKK